jgi:3-oxoacyl-(acyl-carrier-protein) synthase
MVRAMRVALAQEGIAPAAVGRERARHRDSAERPDRGAAARGSGRAGSGQPTKSMIGHTMAAAGTLEAVATVLALGHEVIRRRRGSRTPTRDPVRLRAAGRARRRRRACHLELFGFGGQNVTLVFRRGA